ADKPYSRFVMEQVAGERLNIAAVGTAGRAGADIRGVASQNIVAISDIDANFLGQAATRYSGARKYEDFRVMLEKEADHIDAVVVGTPDHTHAPAAAMALRLKKHVYCEKPLTHTVYESRVLAELTAKNKLVTQMGTQIHAGDNYRRVVELVESGAIGEIREVHVWAGAKYSGAKFTTGTAAPAHVNWDLWLGPAIERPYSSGVHPFKWRSFWDYGTGALGDFGCHYMDLAHWALKLKHPTRVSAQGPPVEAVSTPSWTIAHYEYPQRGKLPPVKLTWYDSGKQPPLLAKLRDQQGRPVTKGSGQLFVGKEGMILSDYSSHRLFPEEKFADLKPPKQSLLPSIGHHQEWINAIKTGGTTTCNFEYSGALTEAVLLGTVAYRSGETIDWDGKQFKATNAPAVQQLLHKEYRKGWVL
ncbi:MAG TPA: Gfo/Idh/MocA family oxidoreductase, partial [Planctomycetaceae bacterium]|nr:Gfo/Idh/MocA family oxidoreductase [Planctomycetaceae bacterium]